MKKLYGQLKYYKKNLKILSNILDKRKKYPTGTLIINKRGDKSYYYQNYYDEYGKRHRIPISDKIDLIKNLAQKNYNMRLKENIDNLIVSIDNLQKSLVDNDIYKLYKNLNEKRKILVDPIIFNYNDEIQKWYDYQNDSMDFYQNRNILTNRGEMVRSKSEKIIADKLYDSNIFYIYEKQVVLEDGVRMTPDFTFIDEVGGEIYWEHFGLMDDLSYFNRTIDKFSLYAKNNIHIGKNLIFTMETSKKVIDINLVSVLIEDFLLDRVPTIDYK